MHQSAMLPPKAANIRWGQLSGFYRYTERPKAALTTATASKSRRTSEYSVPTSSVTLTFRNPESPAGADAEGGVVVVDAPIVHRGLAHRAIQIEARVGMGGGVDPGVAEGGVVGGHHLRLRR